jgi:hypothetical protein
VALIPLSEEVSEEVAVPESPPRDMIPSPGRRLRRETRGASGGAMKLSLSTGGAVGEGTAPRIELVREADDLHVGVSVSIDDVVQSLIDPLLESVVALGRRLAARPR